MQAFNHEHAHPFGPLFVFEGYSWNIIDILLKNYISKVTKFAKNS